MNFVELMKKAAVEAVEASNPSAPMEGTVVSVSPLKIKIDQKKTLTKEFLILTEAVKDYEIEVAVDWLTEDAKHTHTIRDTYTGGGSASENTHNHAVKGKKIMKVHSKLKKGDKVLLIRAAGGQRYYVIGRI